MPLVCVCVCVCEGEWSCLSVQVCGSLCDPSLSLSQEEEEEEKAKAKKAIQLLKVCAQLQY